MSTIFTIILLFSFLLNDHFAVKREKLKMSKDVVFGSCGGGGLWVILIPSQGRIPKVKYKIYFPSKPTVG